MSKRSNNGSDNERNSASKANERFDDFVNGVSGKVLDILGGASIAVKGAMELVIKKLDANSDGEVSIDDIIVLAIKTPGVHINRANFLQKELFKNHPQDVIDRAIQTTPALAGIPSDEIDKIADEVIKRERTSVSGIAVALGMPGGLAMAATIPADILQYYGFTLRAVQQLMYLYGFPEIDTDEEGLFLDSETINTIVLCLGIMYGVGGAHASIMAIARALSVGVEKKLMNMALTKGAVFPVVKSVMKWFGVSLTKSLFAGSIKKAIPVVGGIVGGGITFASFKPCCYRLKNALQDTMLSNPAHKSTAEEEQMYQSIIHGEIIDAEYEDIPEENDENVNSAEEQGSEI